MKDVQPDKIILNDGTDIPYGVLVWSTGVGPSSFVKSLEVPKAGGRYRSCTFYFEDAEMIRYGKN